MKYKIKTPALIKHMYPEWWENYSSWFNGQIEPLLDNARVLRIGKSENYYYPNDDKHNSFSDKWFDIIVMGPYIPKGAEVISKTPGFPNIKAIFDSYYYDNEFNRIKCFCYDHAFEQLLIDTCELYTEPKEVARPFKSLKEFCDFINGKNFFIRHKKTGSISYNPSFIFVSVEDQLNGMYELNEISFDSDNWQPFGVVERVEG